LRSLGSIGIRVILAKISSGNITNLSWYLEKSPSKQTTEEEWVRKGINVVILFRW
jgi:hypothetical protein